MTASGRIPYRTYSTSDFVKRFSNIAQSSQFRATIDIQKLPFSSQYAPANRYTEDLSILCTETSLPGSRFSTSENNQDYYGISQKFAYRKDFDTIDMTFYVDGGYRTLHFFEQWMDFIASPDQSYSVVGDNVASDNSYYRFRYPVEYKTTLNIHKFNKDYEPVYSGSRLVEGTGSKSEIVYTFVNAFPLNIASIPVSYEQSQILRATVTFSYDRYYVDRGTTKPVQTSNTTTQSPFNAGTAGLPSDSYTNSSIADYLRTPTFSPQEQQRGAAAFNAAGLQGALGTEVGRINQ